MTVSKPIYILSILAMLPACNGDSSGQRDAKAPESAISTTQRQNLERVLDAYETVRASLARDELAAGIHSAAGLQAATSGALESPPSRLKPDLTDLQAAAKRLSGMDQGDAEQVRRGFGETSRALVSLLTAEPALRAGHYVFRCPMAKGYQKWIQTNREVSNPYMGKAMPTCGTACAWTSDAAGK